MALPESVQVRGYDEVEPVGAIVSPPSGCELTKDASVDFFQEVLADSSEAAESMSVAEMATSVIRSLYCTGCVLGVAVTPRGASLTGVTVMVTVAVSDFGSATPLVVPLSVTV
jgi:hypothetical protein